MGSTSASGCGRGWTDLATIAGAAVLTAQAQHAGIEHAGVSFQDVLAAHAAAADDGHRRPCQVEELRVRGEVDFENVSFAYDPQRPVLREISLHVAPGETLAVVGETGAGKSIILGALSLILGERADNLPHAVRPEVEADQRVPVAHGRQGARVISHDGRTLFPIMPYRNFSAMPDEDLAAVIVYLKGTVNPANAATAIRYC